MPVHSSYTIRGGSTGRSVLFLALDADGRPARGLGWESPGAAGAYVREGQPAHAMALEQLSEIDPDLMPGVYRLPLPDEVVAEDSPHALILVRFGAATVDPIDIELVAYDPLDERCIGMAQLQDRTRHEFLRRALPNMTEMEFEAGMDSEKQLSDFLAERGGA